MQLILLKLVKAYFLKVSFNSNNLETFWGPRLSYIISIIQILSKKIYKYVSFVGLQLNYLLIPRFGITTFCFADPRFFNRCNDPNPKAMSNERVVVMFILTFSFLIELWSKIMNNKSIMLSATYYAGV